ncbi:hypothetical protein ACIBFB_19940 [Nocardiopsis sp. NPDC050513]|uniref:hypothetical protein n=1 Tax=Nocardiopsis sp. NPDC050513 TaxID=3364338 RepID=UPI0037BD2F84
MTSTPAGLHPALSTRQGFALIEEAASVRNLMRDAIQAIRDMRYVHMNGDAVFTLGSIGVEKAMKVMLGCATVANTDAWPTKEVLKSWGHDIEKLNSHILTKIDEGVEHTTATGYSAQLAGRVKESTLLPLVFAAFARYGRSGRFHHLDILATDEPGEHDQPSEYWEQVELHVQESLPEFREVPYGDNAAVDAYVERLRSFIADELDAWWFCLHRLGVQGCFGDLGKKIGWEIWEIDRPEPTSAGI